MKRHVVLLVFCLLLCRLGVADSLPPASDAPVVLMVRVAENQEATAMETRFVTELRLYIEGFSIQEIPSPDISFVDAPLNRQIDQIRPLMRRHGAVAAMWLHAVSEEVLLLQVVVLDTGRALVRLFEHALMEGSETSLATTAAELLGTAYLFDTETGKRPPPVKALVASTREQAGVHVSRPKRWRLCLTASGGGGFLDSVGPDYRVGGFVGAEQNLGTHFVFTLGLGGFWGPVGQTQEAKLRGYEVNGRVDFFFAPPLNRARIGPVLTFLGGPVGVLVSRPGFPRGDFTQWILRVAAGLQLRVRVSDSVWLTAVLALSATPFRLEVRQRSDDETLYRMGILGGWGSLGVVLF